MDYTSILLLTNTLILLNTTIIAEQENLRQTKFFFHHIKQSKKGDKQIPLPSMIRNLINRQVKVTALTCSYTGKIESIDNNWIRIKQTTEGGKEYYIKDNTITSIKLL